MTRVTYLMTRVTWDLLCFLTSLVEVSDSSEASLSCQLNTLCGQGIVNDC